MHLTTGASSEIFDDLISLGRAVGILLVRVEASLETCLRRIANRDQTQQIPMDRASIEKVYRLSAWLNMPFDLLIQNQRAAEHEIVHHSVKLWHRTDNTNRQRDGLLAS